MVDLVITATIGAGATPLNTLALSASTVSEDAALLTVVGSIVGKTTGSTLSLTDNAGGRFAISGTNIVVAGTLDYEANTSHSITIRESLAGASNTPHDTVLTINVIDVAGPSVTGSLSNKSYAQGTAITNFDTSTAFTIPVGSGTTVYSLAPSSAPLPSGLSLSSAGLLTGTPTEVISNAAIVIRCSTNEGYAETGFSLSVLNSSSTHTARFGAKTRASAGGWKPVDSNGDPIDLTSYDGLVSGSLGSYVPSISSGKLVFNIVGSPSNVTLNCTTSLGTQIQVVIGTPVANMYSVSSLGEADTAYENSVLGDVIELRAGYHNPNATRATIARGQSPSGTWTGTSILSDGNWVQLIGEPSKKVWCGAMEVGGNGLSHPRYLKVDHIEFVSPFNADSNGLGTGVSANCSGQFFTQGGSHVAIGSGCTFRHVLPVTHTTTGAFVSINSSTTDLWIEGVHIDGAFIGIKGYVTRSIIRKCTIENVVADCGQISRCTDAIIEGNWTKNKLYGWQPQTILGITTGATTTIQVADASWAVASTSGELLVFSGVSGALGSFLNGQAVKMSSKNTSVTPNTITVDINTTGQSAWDGAAGIAQITKGLHGDHWQFNSDPGANNLQDRCTMRGNRMSRGRPAAGTTLWPGGQGIFAGVQGTARTRDGWLIEGNIFDDVFQRAISVDNLTNSTIRSNTCIRQLGLDAVIGTSEPSIYAVGAVAANNTVVDNIANLYSLGASVVTNINNHTVVLTNSTAAPPTAGTIAAYQAAFVDPWLDLPTVDYDPTVKYATRTDAGGQFSGLSIMPGATPYMNFNTLVYSNPR